MSRHQDSAVSAHRSRIHGDIDQFAGVVLQLKEQWRQAAIEVNELEAIRAENGQIGFAHLEAQLALVTGWIDRVGQIKLTKNVRPPPRRFLSVQPRNE